MDMPDMDKRNPKGRKLDKSGNPIVTMDAVKKAGFTNLRDYLNDKRGLKRRDGKAPERTKEYMAKNMDAPMSAPAVRANPMGGAARDKAIMTDEARKRNTAKAASAPPNVSMQTPSDDDMKRAKAMTAKAQEEKYGSGLKMGGKVKGYKSGGSPGMHHAP
jgi:hypothetical protein